MDFVCVCVCAITIAPVFIIIVVVTVVVAHSNILILNKSEEQIWKSQANERIFMYIVDEYGPHGERTYCEAN